MMTTKLPTDYAERVYAGWLGKCIGVRLGAPVEGWTAEEIRNTLGEVRDFLPLPANKLFKPDDDTAFPMVILRALEDYGPGVTAEQMGETVLNYLGDTRGTFWWGGYGVSSEHTAYLNLARGVKAPHSGSIAMNGAPLAEQIGGQIFSDIWGLIAPNNPELAAEYGAKAASVTHDGDGIRGGRFVAGLVSAAFSERDPRKLVAQGLALVESDSEYTRVVNAVVDFHNEHPGDWRACYDFLHANFGYDRYPGAVHIIPNTGIVVMALLYGEGDFSRTVQIATMGGWDTDCNAGNVGAIMGVAVGLQGIDMRWRTQMNDLLVNASIIGSRNLIDIPACADLFVRLGEQVAGVEVTRKARYHFDYPDSTQGATFRTRGATINEVRSVDGALSAAVFGLTKKGEAEVVFKLSCRPADLSANFYGASFSPKLYPGQTITARVHIPEKAGNLLHAALFVWDDNGKARHQAQAAALTPGEWTTLTYTVPSMHNALLSEVGIVLRNLGEAWTGALRVDDLDWSGAATYTSDFASEKTEFGAISQWTYLRGYWRLEAGAYHGSGADRYESYTGDVVWTDYTVSAEVTPVHGGEHALLARVQGARRSYSLALVEDKRGKRLQLSKNEGGYRELISAPFVWNHASKYTLALRFDGKTLYASVDQGGPNLRYADNFEPYLNGEIGVGGGGGSHTIFHSIQVEPA